LVRRRYLPWLTRRAWATASAIGAAVCWALGMTIGAYLAPSSEPGPLAVTVAAGLLGAFAGALLGAAQWVVLRHHLPGAAWWIAANALGWVLGMVVAFGGMGLIPADVPIVLSAALGAGTGATMALSPAAATGFALAILLRRASLRTAATWPAG
ncbi:MAG: hypothetical protein M3281_00760, partial [Chloroflexota bacterium]|nr:hypothetical protein [Chloroflexota bacterium]